MTDEITQELVIYEDGSIQLFLNGEVIRKKWSTYKKVIDVFVELLELQA